MFANKQKHYQYDWAVEAMIHMIKNHDLYFLRVKCCGDYSSNL